MDDDDVGNHRFVTVILIQVFIVREEFFRFKMNEETMCEKRNDKKAQPTRKSLKIFTV